VVRVPSEDLGLSFRQGRVTVEEGLGQLDDPSVRESLEYVQSDAVLALPYVPEVASTIDEDGYVGG
jgi:hypothetical protein